MTDTTRNALIFGARNLGRSVIETLVAQGWSVAGAARSDETLANVTAAGALALRSDITDQAAVRATVKEAAHKLGGLDLVVNAAAAYGGTRTGVFGGGPRVWPWRRRGGCGHHGDGYPGAIDPPLR